MSNLFMRFPKGKAKALTLSYDDGVVQDVRLMSILNKFGLKCTFNINTGLFEEDGHVFPKGQIHRRMSKREAVELYKDSGHEVAVHALTHPFLEQLPTNMVAYEVVEDRKNIEKLFGKITKGMAYPFGTYSDKVVDVLKDAGIVYSRTVNFTEKFDIPTDWLRLPATCHHDNPNLITLAKKFIEDSPQDAPWLFYLWGHSYEFEINDNWHIIEEFSETIGQKNDIWYATNIEVYNYIQAYNRLEFSLDASIVYNPTDIELYFSFGGKQFNIKSGETVKI